MSSVNKFNNSNNDPPPIQVVETTPFYGAVDNTEDNFEIIFVLFSQALKCIRLHKLEVGEVQKNYEAVAYEIRGIRDEQTIDNDRLKRLIEKCDRLAKLTLESSKSEKGFSELGEIYAQLRGLYDEELSAICSRAPLLQQDRFNNQSFLCNLLSGLKQDPLQKARLEKLSPMLHGPLNDKLREIFDQQLDRLKTEFPTDGKKTTCFICYNVEEPDVVKWLKEILVPDLRAIGIKPIYSKENLPPGGDLGAFEAHATTEDFAIVLCTPALHQKRLRNSNSGVATEIKLMQPRFFEKEGTTIPILLKKEEGGDPNDVNPFKDHPQNPFAVLAPLDRYANIFELFVVLLKPSNRENCRKRALDCIKTVESEGIKILEDLLQQQEAVIRNSFEECLPMLGDRSSNLKACIISDGKFYTDCWIKDHLLVDLRHLNVSCAMKGSEGADFIFRVDLQGNSDVSISVGRSVDRLNKSFDCLMSSKEGYFKSALEIFSYMFEADFQSIYNEFLKIKGEKIQGLVIPLANQKQELIFAKTPKELLTPMLKYAIVKANKDHPETIDPRLISYYKIQGKFALKKKDCSLAKQWFARANDWSLCKYGQRDPSYLALQLEIGLLCYELAVNKDGKPNPEILNEAIKAYQRVLSVREDDYVANLNLARIHFILGNLEQAEERFCWSLTLADVSASTRVDYANFLLYCKRFEESEGCLMHIITNQPDCEVSYAYIDFPILSESLSKVLRIEEKIRLSTRQFAFYLLIENAIETKEVDNAVNLCEEFSLALEQRPKTLGYTLLGFLYERLENDSKAVAAFQRALELNPYNRLAQSKVKNRN